MRRNVQAVLAIPGLETLQKCGFAAYALMQNVAGVPLLVRIIATAARANVDSVLIIWPEDINPAILASSPESALLADVRVDHLIWPTAFDPRSSAQWVAIAGHIDDEFLWLPWNWVTHKKALDGLSASCVRPVTWQFPVLLETSAILKRARFRVSSGSQMQGLAVTSLTSIRTAERFLVEHSANPTDGINAQFNQRVCAPVVRLLTHTRVTQQAINIAGLLFAILAAVTLARGSYLNYVTGAMLFFLSGLCDEMDIMLSRLKFCEPDFSSWFKILAGNVSFLTVFVGLVVGLHRQYGVWAFKYGSALIIGCILSVVVIGVQRKLAATPNQPQDYARRMTQLMEADSSNLISRNVRRIHIFMKKPVLAQFVLLFAVSGALPLFLYLATLASHLTWILALYFSRRFFPTPPLPPVAQDVRTAA
jgi:hypothetical protein